MNCFARISALLLTAVFLVLVPILVYRIKGEETEEKQTIRVMDEFVQRVCNQGELSEESLLQLTTQLDRMGYCYELQFFVSEPRVLYDQESKG